MPAPKNNKNALGHIYNREKEYTFEDIKNVLIRFSNGEKLKDILKGDNMPSNGTLLRYIHESVELQKLYAQAREFHGDQFNNEIEEIKSDLRTGKLNSNEARTLADIVKWQAAKFYPKMYGDKIDVTSNNQKITGTTGLEGLTFEQLLELENAKRKK